MPSLRDAIRNHQLRTVCHDGGVATIQAKIVGTGVVAIIQLEAQAELSQATVGGKPVDFGYCTDKVDTVDVIGGGGVERSVGATGRRLEIFNFQAGFIAEEAILDVYH